MLLREYLLLNLGRITPADARAWLADMTARRRVDACRDLLCFWQPREAEGEFGPDQLAAYAVVGWGRQATVDPVAGFVSGLHEAVRRALAHYGVEAGVYAKGSGLFAGDRQMGSVRVSVHGGVAVGLLVVELAGLQAAVLRNAIAYHFEEQLGYQPAATHPVAYEESMRPQG